MEIEVIPFWVIRARQRDEAKRRLINRMRQKAAELGLNFDFPYTQKHLLDFADYYHEFVTLVRADNDRRSFREIELRANELALVLQRPD